MKIPFTDQIEPQYKDLFSSLTEYEQKYLEDKVRKGDLENADDLNYWLYIIDEMRKDDEDEDGGDWAYPDPELRAMIEEGDRQAEKKRRKTRDGRPVIEITI